MHTFRRLYNPLKLLCCQQRYKEEVLDVKIRQGDTIESGCEEVLDVKIRQGYTIESGYFRILPMFKDFFVVCTTLDIYVFIHR